MPCNTDESYTGQQNTGYPRSLNGSYPRSTPNELSGEPTYNDNGGLSTENLSNQRRTPRSVPPEPLTEFQRIVADSVGQILPIFGANLFRDVPSTYSPVEQVPVTADYVIGPGDVLRVRVWGQIAFSANLKVDRAGSIYLPKVGEVHVAGLRFSDLDQHVRSAISRVYRNFEMSVDLGELRSIQVFVVGHARTPGAYTISSLSTILNALFASGGPSTQGSMRHILLKRDNQTVTDFDFYDLLLNGDKSKDARLLTGDVIFIPPVGPQVAIAGSVRKPAIYEVTANSTIGQLLQYAGGASSAASGARISLERISGHQSREAMEVAMDSPGLATTLQDGDLVRVLSIVPRFDKTVTLRGNLANPGRFAWHSGMRLSDLIPDKESLITRNYWWRRTQLGLPAPEFLPLSGTRGLVQPNVPVDLPRSRDFYPNGEPDYSGQGIPSPRNTTGLNSEGIYVPPSQTKGTGNTQADPSANQTNPQDQTDLADPRSTTANQANGSPNNRTTRQNEPQAGGSTLASQQSQVITQNVAASTGKTDVRLSAPEIDWSYAVIERLDRDTLKTSLIPFNLGKLVLGHEADQDIPVMPGDVVTVFSQADIRVPLDQQTKFVHLEGEFASSGIYSVLPGETLRHLVERSGGFSQHAYLFGSEFTRESTRVAQQQRLDEYVRSVETQLQRSQLALAAASARDLGVVGNVSDSGQQAVLSRLRQLRATGRIVLELKPNSIGVATLPDLPLEDGDRFVVPPVPADVKVFGAVYDQNSFVYRSSRRTGDYLKLAGGPNRDADRSHMFIIRADGSVLSHSTSSSYWGNTFAAAHLNPGDTIVVPEKVFGPSTLRSILDWSQVFSQLALGAAAINVIK